MQAQDDDESLTEEFAGMSPKERARIAKKEQEEAREDPAYQAIMVQAEDHFRNARYEQALASYREARTLRPLNVYPKVKIKDVKALIAQRQAAAAAVPVMEKPVEDPIEIAPAPVSVEVPALEPLPSVEKDEAPSSAPEPSVERGPAVVSKPTQAKETRERTVETIKPKPVDGLSERRSKEGNAEVVERILTAEGRSTVFKRVAHTWGQVFYFEDGRPIDPRVWKQRFND